MGGRGEIGVGVPGRARTGELVAVHSLGWLTAGNLVGLLLAALLVAPRLGGWLGPLTYGRWMPVHLDLQLYGWCALPLVGLLLRCYLPAADDGRLPRVALGVWSGTLFFGAVSWLAGQSSGKLFLEWSGLARVVLAAAFVVLWVVLAVSWWRRVRDGEEPLGVGASSRVRWAGKLLLLLSLAAVPVVMWIAGRAELYPPINPDSGGATGGSLMGSSLGIVAVLALAPWALGLELRGHRGWPAGIAAGLALHFAWFLALDHGDHSHHEPLQIVSLASLLLWAPVLVAFARQYRWPAGAARWLVALGSWGGVLAVTGWLTFLPGMLERFKFTDLLVGHAHLAMAGMVTSANGLILLSLTRSTRLAGVLARPAPFWLWHGGCAVLILALVAAGAREAGLEAGIAVGDPVVGILYAARLLAGAAMAAASVWWLLASALRLSAVEEAR